MLILLFCTATIHSQNSASINGNLIDKEYNNEPLAFGTVSIKGTVQETYANIDGDYVFSNLNPGEYVLVFSFVGYKTQEKIIKLKEKDVVEVNVAMEAIKPSFEKTVTSSATKQEGQIVLTSS